MNEWTIHAAVRTGKGRVRRNNEDAFYLNGAFLPLEAMDQETARCISVPLNGTLFAVCDGIGGRDRGEVASNTAVSGMTVLQESLRRRRFESAVQGWLRQMDCLVKEKSDEGGCTLTLAYFESAAIRIAHVGDSRIYRLHAGALSRLTKDHSKVQMLISSGRITEEEARNHPERHVITRYVGMVSDFVFCEAEIGRPLPVIPGDRYMLCSDGVTDMLEDAAIERILTSAPTADECAEAVYQAALAAGGRDNTTVIIAEIGGGAPDVPLPMTFDDDNEPTLRDGLDDTI